MAVDQILQLFGAFLIVIAFGLSTFRIVTVEAYSYLLLNLVGSIILAVLALQTRQWGFVMLEAVWTIISLYSIAIKLLKTPRS